MRTIITGIIVFILWSALCTWYYVTRIKGPASEEGATIEQTAAELAPEAPEPDSLLIAPETTVESPGSFTVFHEFDRSSVIPDEQFDSYIERLRSFVEQNEHSRLQVVGYTDNVGSVDYNLRLGQTRAESTRDYLAARGVPATLITLSSKGESAPVASNETDAGRAQNRRTDIQIVE